MPGNDYRVSYLVFNGSVYPDNHFVYRSSYRSDNSTLYRREQQGPVVAELLDGAGNLLLRHPLAAREYCLDGESSSALHVRGAVPFAEGTRLIRVLRDGARVFELRVSDAAPDVRTRWQPPRQVEGRQTISWETRHAEGLPVQSFLRYSHDNGERWERITPTRPEESVEIDFDRLPGGDQCRLAIVASDGVNTTTVETEPFRVPVKPCRALITAPSDGTNIEPGQEVTLQGQGFYLEENEPESQQLTWSSSRDGELGTGRIVVVPRLSPGEHQITLTAGSGERAGTAMLTLYVGGAHHPSASAEAAAR
jgi:hypothetical protein